MPFFKSLRIPEKLQRHQQPQPQQPPPPPRHQQLQQQQYQRPQPQQPSNGPGSRCAGEIIPTRGHNRWLNSQVDGSQQQQQQQQQEPQLAFYCQLAHGSPTGLISGFGNVRELYYKIAECFDIRPEEILFCTLNTHKIDMSELIGGQIGLDDFIYAHKKGRPKEIELIKTEDALGLTLSDNGAGYVFIKRIKEKSIMDRLGIVQIGDHIEKLNGESLVGKKHFEVARRLKNIARGSTLTVRLIEPLTRSGFGVIGPRCGPRSRAKFSSYASGRETLRFKADGQAKIEQVNEDDKTFENIERVNNALEIYMGISDNVLARRLWEIAQNKINSMDLAKAIDSSMPDAFDFPEDLIFEVWKIAFQARNNHH